MLSFFSRKKEEQTPPMSVTQKSTVQMSSPSPWASQTQQKQPAPSFTASANTWRQPVTPKPSAFPTWQNPQTWQTPAKPQTQQKVTTPQLPNSPLNPNYKPPQPQPQTSPVEDYLAKIKAIADSRKNLYREGATEQQGVLDAVNARNQQRLLEQQERLTGAKDRSISNMKGYMSDLDAEAERARTLAAEESGQAQKKSIQAGREEQARLQNLFGDLGTIDSSTFQDQAIKAEQRGTERFRDFEQAKVARIEEVERNREAGRREAESKLYDIETTFADQLGYINEALAQGSEQWKLAVSDLWRNTQDAIYQLDDSVTRQEMAYQQQMSQLSSTQLSEGFLTTGQPQNRADYEWMVNNRDKYDQSFVNQGQVDAQKQDLLSLVKNAASGDLGVISGAWGRSGLGTLWGEGLETKNLVDQIKNKLTVEAREKLRGQGQISDKETEMLANSVAKLQPGMTEAGLKKELQEIQNILEGKYRYADAGSQLPPLQSFIL